MANVNTEDLEQLAEICLQTAKTIKEHLNANNKPQPTFDQNGPPFFPSLSPEAEMARIQLRCASKTLYDLASGPEEPIGNHIFNSIHDINSSRYVQRYKIAQLLKNDETITYGELASRSGTDERQLKKMVRQLIQSHVFCEPKPGFVSHTASSKHFLHTGLAAYNGYISIDCLPLVERQIDAFEKWGHGSQDPTETPAALYYGNNKSCYESYQDHPETLTRFSNVMKYVSSWDIYSISHAVNGYDWTSIGDGTVVDVGGSMGHCCAAIAEAYPRLKFIVQDLPQVVARAKSSENTMIPDNLKDRISFMEHSFYDEQPVVGADVYFLRMIFHDYSDQACLKILRALIPAMRSKSRIVIMDQVVPQHGTLPHVLERMARTLDSHMLLLTNATERELPEWEALFAEADKKLSIKQVVTPPGALHGVIEVAYDGSSE